MKNKNESLATMIVGGLALEAVRENMVILAQIHQAIIAGHVELPPRCEFFGRIMKAAAEFVDVVMTEKAAASGKGTATPEDAMDLIRKAATP